MLARTLTAATISLLVCAAVLVTSSCSRPRESEFHEQILALGTLIDINFYGISAEKAHAATGEVRAVLEDINNTWHAWQPSLVTRINAHIRAGQASEVPAPRLELIRKSITMTKLSNGLFDPGIGALSELWGFHSDTLPSGPPPDRKKIMALVAKKPSILRLHIEGSKVWSDNPATQLDFGAIAKGYAIDQSIARLRALGVKNAIVNAGGDLRAIGRHGDRPWRIGIRDPRGAGVLASVNAEGDQSIFTSGDYERFYDYHNKRYHHIIDPRTGYPARGTRSVTVVTEKSAATADAAATALFVAGPRDWQNIARALNLDRIMLVDSDNTVHLTKKMASIVHFELEPPPKITISDQL